MQVVLRYIGITVFLIATVSSWAQQNGPYTHPKKYKLDSPFRGLPTRFQSYQYYTATNLFSNSFRDITVDRDGRVWVVGNNQGFGCIDGENAYLYGTHNNFFDRIRMIEVDNEGMIWVGGNGTGVFSLSGSYYWSRFMRAEAQQEFYGWDWLDCSDVHIKGIKTDRKNNTWVGTALGGVYCIKEDTTIWWNDKNSDLLTATNSNMLTIDNEDRAWFICDKILYYIENDILHQIDSSIFKPREARYISGDTTGALLVQSSDLKFWSVTPEGKEEIIINFPEGKPQACFNMRRDKEGTIFIGNEKTIYKLVGNVAVDVIGLDEKIGINKFTFDNSNGLWVATGHKGIIHIPQMDVMRFTDRDMWAVNKDLRVIRTETHLLRAKHLNSEVIDFDTLLEVGIQEDYGKFFYLSHGIYMSFRGKGYYYSNDGELDLSKAQIYGKYEYGWGTHENRNTNTNFYKTTDNKIHYEVTPGEIVKTEYQYNGRYDVIHEDGDKIFVFNPEGKDVFHYLTFEDGIVDTVFAGFGGDTTRVNGCYYINDTTIIYPTWGDFFYRLTPSGATRFGLEAGSNIVWGEYVDALGNYWVGGIEGGINYIDGRTFAVVNLYDEDGLKGSTSKTARGGSNGLIVVTTNKGITSYRLKDGNKAVNSKEDFFDKYEIRYYGNEEGLLGEGFTTPYYSEQNGSIWFNSNGNELHIILPGNQEESGPSNLRFENIQLESASHEINRLFKWIPGREHTPPEEIRLDYKERLIVTIRSVYFRNFHKQKYSFRIDEGNWSDPQGSAEFRIAGLESGEHTIHFKALSEKGVESESISLKVVIDGPVYESAWFWFLCVLGLFTVIYLVFRWRTVVVRARARHLEKVVQERTEEIEMQKTHIEVQHTEIKDSIEYAKRIQEAILPSDNRIQKIVPESFVLYKPKDIVAGDFYWFVESGDYAIFAAADCTGHGVPGAMVSVVCHNALNRSVREFGLTKASDILNKTRELVIETFEQSESSVKDGMDIAICSVDRKTMKLTFSGANNPIYHVRKGELNEIKGDKQPVGIFENASDFTGSELQLEQGDIIYGFTDGFADQFGGEKGKKFKYKPFKEFLLQNWSKSMSEQLKIADEMFESWKGDLEQVDDVCIIGVRF